MPTTDADIVVFLRGMVDLGFDRYADAVEAIERLTAEVERLKAAHEQEIEAAVRWAIEQCWPLASRPSEYFKADIVARFKAQKGGSA